MMYRDSSSSLVNTKYVHTGMCYGSFCGKKISQYVTNYAAFLENHVEY